MESHGEAEALFHQHLLELLHEFEQLRALPKPSRDARPQPIVLAESNSVPKEREPVDEVTSNAEASQASQAAPLGVSHELQNLYIRLASGTSGKISWSTLEALLAWKGVRDSKDIKALLRDEANEGAELSFRDFTQLMCGDLKEAKLLQLRQILGEEAAEASFSNMKNEKSKSWWRALEDIPQGFLLEIVPAFVIMVNAVVIGVSLDVNPNSTVWQVFEWVFTILFTTEALMRMRLMGCVTYFTGGDAGWNYFDLTCLACAYADIVVTATLQSLDEGSGLDGIMLIKVLRLGRVCRLIRVMRFGAVRELRVIILGVLSGIRVLFWAIALLFFTVYIIGVSAKMIIPEVPEFEGVMGAMFTAFRCVTDGCSDRIGAPLHEYLRKEYGDGLILIYMVLYLFVVIGIFNLIMAVFLDSVLSDHQARELQELGEKSREMEQHITHVMANLVAGRRSKDGPKTLLERIRGLCGRRPSQNLVAPAVHRHMNQEVIVARRDFNKWLEYPEMIDMLSQCKIETATKHDLFDVLDAEMSDALHFNELVDGLMRLRGSITKVDVIALRLKMRHLVRLVQSLAD